MDLQFDPIAKLSTANYCLTLKTKDHEIQHMQLKLVHKIHLHVGTTKAHVYQQTLGFTQCQNNLSKDLRRCKIYTPKQSRNRPMVILQVYLAPKQSRTDL